MNDEDVLVQLTITQPTLSLIYQCVEKAHRNWAGGDAEEQMLLEELKMNLFACVLDMQFPPEEEQ